MPLYSEVYSFQNRTYFRIAISKYLIQIGLEKIYFFGTVEVIFPQYRVTKYRAVLPSLVLN